MKIFQRLFGTPTFSTSVRRAGYVKDQMGIQNRYVREREQWNPHLEQTKQYILQAVSHLSDADSIAVLGSGWLLDIPWQELSQQFRTVSLFDIVHPEQVVVKTRKISNIHLETVDLTGGAVQLAEQVSTFEEFLQKLPDVHVSHDFSSYSMVVSVNLLNQLDILLCDYLSHRFNPTQEELQQVRRLVQQQHIASLPKGKTCLISDYEEINIPLNQAPAKRHSLLFCNLPEGREEKQWEWIFDTTQTYREGMNTTLLVKALLF